MQHNILRIVGAFSFEDGAWEQSSESRKRDKIQCTSSVRNTWPCLSSDKVHPIHVKAVVKQEILTNQNSVLYRIERRRSCWVCTREFPGHCWIVVRTSDPYTTAGECIRILISGCSDVQTIPHCLFFFSGLGHLIQFFAPEEKVCITPPRRGSTFPIRLAPRFRKWTPETNPIGHDQIRFLQFREGVFRFFCARCFSCPVGFMFRDHS